MEIIIKIFGEGKDLSALQMSARALVVYVIALLFIRISGRRTFGKKSSFDTTLTIILGAVLSRAIAGASPFVPTIACSLLLVLLHRGVSWLVLFSPAFGNLIKGHKRPLYQDGKVHEENLKKCLMTRDDLISDVRLKANEESLDSIAAIYMEASGELSVIKKQK
jgi:uncharacterized membrane protein YcaP (DUF421 family)